MPRLMPTVIPDDRAIDYLLPLHERWVSLVQQGKIVTMPIPLEKKDADSLRNKINGALRTRGVKASVRKGFDNDGHPVFVIALKN